jgi:microcystin degradation protein MlrC
LDGLLVAPHGATVAENAADADGDWLSRVRQIVGPDLPIVGTLDLHANVSARMATACDALFGYRSNPHLDQFERGLQAGRCLVRALLTGIRPQMSLIQLPLCVNIERQATEEAQGIALRAESDRLAESEPGVHGISYLFGFPYSDVPEMGASVLAVADARDTAPPTGRGTGRFLVVSERIICRATDFGGGCDRRGGAGTSAGPSDGSFGDGG